MPLGAARFGLLGGVADLGKLELIETQTFSTSVAQIDFTDIQEDIYNVHLLTGTVIFGSGNADLLSMRFFESGVLETASVYQIATQLGTAGGYFTETKSTGIGDLYFGESSIEPQSFYCYIYNAGDSSKYTFTTIQLIVKILLWHSCWIYRKCIYK